MYYKNVMIPMLWLSFLVLIFQLNYVFTTNSSFSALSHLVEIKHGPELKWSSVQNDLTLC